MLVEGRRKRDRATIEKHELFQYLHRGFGRLPCRRRESSPASGNSVAGLQYALL